MQGTFAHLLATGIEFYVAFSVVYILLPLFFFPFFYRKIRNSISNFPSSTPQKTHFILLIPAHNEAKSLPFLLKSIREQNYPSRLIEPLVVADNCSDSTAEIAQKMGFQTLIRTTDRPSSKDQAMQAGLLFLKENRLLESRWIAVIDGDSALDRRFLAAVDAAVQVEKSPAVFQTFRSVHNGCAAPVASIDAASEALRQWIGLGVRAELGLEASLHGTGTIFPASIFEKLSAKEQAVFADDKQWRIHLFEEKNLAVRWIPAAHLTYESVVCNLTFGQQRSRWIAGQLGLLRRYLLPIFWQGLRRMDVNRLDFAFSILQLPRSLFLFLTVFWVVLSQFSPSFSALGSSFWLAALIFQIIYWLLGMTLAGSRLSFFETCRTAFSMAARVAGLTIGQIFGRRNKVWGQIRS